MQAVILAAGRGTRLRPLTNTTPKVLLEIAPGKAIIDLLIDALPEEVSDVILVVNHLRNQIKAYCGEERHGRKISYVEHQALDGTAKALWACEKVLGADYLVLHGDDIYTASDLSQLMSHPLALLACEREGIPTGGHVLLKEDGKLKEVQEYPGVKMEKYLLGCGAYKLNRKFFDYEPVLMNEKSDEYGLPQTLSKMAKDYEVAVELADDYQQINTIEDLEKAKEKFKI